MINYGAQLLSEAMAGGWLWCAAISVAFIAGCLVTSFHIRPFCRHCGERHPNHEESYLCGGPGVKNAKLAREGKPHEHLWVIFKIHGVGRFDKQEGLRKSAVYCSGRIEKCSLCPQKRIIPDNKDLRTVEIEDDLV